MATPPDLEERFTAPPGWRTGEFFNALTNHKIHYGTVKPDSGTPAGTVVILPGLSEFTEKYYETARDLLARNFSVWVIDWAYQGRSTRFAGNPMRRHSDGFESDIADLHKLIGDHVLPAARDAPLIMIGHSMGGHLGLRYLASHPGLFHTAVLSAPMIGIAQLRKMPGAVVKFMMHFLRLMNALYVPPGTDWHEEKRKSDGNDIFSSDPLRDALHNSWCRANPELRVGDPTGRWVYEALASCQWLIPRLEKITTCVLLVRAGQEEIVDNDAIARAAALLPRAQMLDLPAAHHEILMERDDSRMAFFKAFDKCAATLIM